MIRALAAILLVLLTWPWIAWPAINSGFRLLSGMVEWHWDFANTIHNWRNLFDVGFRQTLFLFLPALLLLRYLRWTSFWIYPLLGVVLGFMGPMLVIFLPAADDLEVILDRPSVLLVTFRPNEFSHYQIGSSIASAVTLAGFWLVAVWKNPWFPEKRPAPAASEAPVR